MTNAITGIDHVLVGVDDLDGAARVWRRLGFTLTPRGRHVGRMSGNYCVMFENDYVELIGIVDPTLPEPPNIAALRRMGEGLIATAMATEGADTTHAAFAAAGLEPLDVAELGRVVELPEGDAEVRFRLVQLPAERTPEFRFFVCDHQTSELARRPEWLRHPNGVLGLRDATVTVARPAALAPALAAVFGTDEVSVDGGRLTVVAGPHRIRFAPPGDLPALLPGYSAPTALAPPKGIAVGFRIADADATAAYLERAGVAFTRTRHGCLAVQPADANGVFVEFDPA